jgi:hypothetical protein
MRICGRKDYLSDSFDPDTGMNWWWERTRCAHCGYVERPKFAFRKCLSLAQINSYLDRLHLQMAATESILWQLLADADRFRKAGGEVYWLTVMRIAELAILTAGAYADGCEFQMAGDLLANPARVLIHLKDRKRPLVKKRHVSLSAMLRKEVGSNLSFMDWFRRHVLLEMTQKALLPHLVDRLGACGPSMGCIDMGRYQQRLETRMQAVVDTIAFLSAWQVDNAADLHAKMQARSPETRRFINDNLCRFEDTQFNQIGALIRNMVTGGTPFNNETAPQPSE